MLIYLITMSTWSVTVRFERNNIDFDFVDIREMVNGIVYLRGDIFRRFLELALSKPNYSLSFNPFRVRPPEKVAFHPEQYLVIFATDNYDLKYGLLLVVVPDKVILAGLWPSGLAEAISGDKSSIETLIYTLAERTDHWKEVIIILHESFKEIIQSYDTAS